MADHGKHPCGANHDHADAAASLSGAALRWRARTGCRGSVGQKVGFCGGIMAWISQNLNRIRLRCKSVSHCGWRDIR
jgi:hypothetical protein